MTTLQASPQQKILTSEEATQKLLQKRAKVVANSPLKAALKSREKPWMRESIQEIVGYSERRRKLEEKGVLPKLTDEEIAAAVEAYRRREADVGPTPERMAKGDIKREVIRAEGVRYRPRTDIVQRYSGKWRPEAEISFLRYIDVARAAEVTNVTINYNGNGGGGHDRMGGLGAAHATKIADYNCFTEVTEALPKRLQRVCAWFLLGEPNDEGRHMTQEEIGGWLFPHINDKRSREMIALGFEIASGDYLATLFRNYDIGHRHAELRAPMRTVNP